MPRIAAKHPLVVRLAHWVNAITLGVMIWSGLLIYWAHDAYSFEIPVPTINGLSWVKVIPDSFYEALDLDFGLATGMAYHFAFAWVFSLNGLVYVTYTFWSGYWRHLRPTWMTPVEAIRVALSDLGLRRERPPQGMFNSAQKLAYGGVILFGAGSVLSGLAILKPTQLWWLTAAFGGYQAARLIHFALMVLYLLFFVVHIAQVARAGWNNFRAMVAGYEVVRADRMKP